MSKKSSLINSANVCTFVIQLDVLEYIHDKEYVHADIKASNLLLGYTDPQQVTVTLHFTFNAACMCVLTAVLSVRRCINPLNASYSKLLLFEVFSTILVYSTIFNF